METAFRILAEQSHDLISRTGKDEQYAYVSQACRELLGYEPSELIGTPGRALLHPDDLAQVSAKHQRAVGEAVREFSFTARMRQKSGAYRWMDVSVYPVYAADGALEFVSVARDASRRVRAEASEAQLKAILDAVPGMILQWLVYPDGRSEYLYVNEWPHSALGVDTNPLDQLNDRLTAIADPEDSKIAWAAAARAIETLEPWVWRGRFYPKDGEVIHVVGHTKPERRPDGAVMFTGALLDDTQRNQIAQTLYETEQLFGAVITNMEMAHIRFGLDGVVQLVNPAAVRLLRYDDATQLVGLSAGKNLWLSPVRFTELSARVRDEGVASIECPLRCRDGSLRTVKGALRLARDAGGHALAIDAILHDVTEELMQREELVQAREAAEAGSRAKSAFLTNMSHEIRTPMNAIIGLSHLALDANPPPKLREYLTQIRGAGVALLDILNDVLDGSKIEAGKLSLELAPFELDRVLEQVARVVTVRADDRKLKLHFSIGPDVPGELLGDRIRLGQVLLNLASNAVKFTDRGDITLGVQVSARLEDKVRLRFLVRDTGIGMTDEQRKQLFKPFSQVDSSTTRRHGGTGLGLAISQQLVRMMGGVIEVDSALGQGSEFRFEIELGIPAADSAPAGRATIDVRDLRVLVVDDNQLSRDSLTRSLLAMNLAVCAVSSGEAALRTLREAEQRAAPFQLALIDALMPGMSGLELSTRINEHPELSEPPALVMISAHSRDEVDAGEDLSHLHAFLRKPISRSTLLATIVEATQASAKRSKSHAPSERAARRALSGLRLLVVEDNEINQILARDLLLAEGADVVLASNGHEALRLADDEKNSFDVILMDVQMPGMDGHATTRVLRKAERTRKIPIVAMTAHAFDAERKRCLESGMNAHVAKPINPGELVRTILAWARGGPASVEASEPPPSDEYLAFDPSALRSVFREPERQLAFLRKFVESAQASLASLESAWQRHDLEQIGFAGHKLKSSAKACGAHALAAVLADFERLSKTGDWSRIAPLAGVAEQMLADVARQVANIPDGTVLEPHSGR